MDHIVAIAELELHILPLHRGAMADPGDLELLGEAFGDPGNEICDHSAGHAPHGARLFGILAHGNLKLVIFELGDQLIDEHMLELALRPLHCHFLAIYARGDPAWDRHGLFADTGHDRTFASLA